MPASITVYVREGCPHCERLLRALEACEAVHMRGVQIHIVPMLAGPLLRGAQQQLPLERVGGELGGIVPQTVIRLSMGGRVLELVLAGAPRDEREFCRTLSMLLGATG